ncbi:hypothetical protein HMPREF9290_0639 [Anaerococcus prevotii ACS-065-V-Col13]|uniref:Uncharacterized protein n=1 Tax=Anaerococcus prevotii ACS-065-V-Col13 TaxID=879305 RepID=F0GWY9_9FIRM|nr:hypothetical protein HMPREF9290_0639 [Anaerococcus prevotii ACS-065-V-Col13]
MVGENLLYGPSESTFEHIRIKAFICIIWVAPRDLRPNWGEVFFIYFIFYKEKL